MTVSTPNAARWINTSAAPEDEMLAVIADLEARLASLRENQHERVRLQSALDAAAGTLETTRSQLSGRYAQLEEKEREIDGEFRVVEAERASVEAERIEVVRRLSDLARTDAVDSSLREELKARETALSDREERLAARMEELEDERRYAERDREEIDREQARLREQARAQQEQARRLEVLEADLKKRETELDEEFRRFERRKVELSAESEVLREALGRARAEAERADERVKAEAGRADTLEGKCGDLERDRSRMRSELSRLKRELAEAEHIKGTQQQQDGHHKKSKQVGPIIVAIWVLTVGLSALAAFIGVAAESIALGAGMVGVVFSASVLAFLAVARRIWDPAGLVVALFAGTAGVWASAWYGGVQTALLSWDLPIHRIPVEIIANIEPAVAAFTACLAVGVVVCMACSGSGMLGLTVVAAIGAGFLLGLSDNGGMMPVGAAVAWSALMAAALGRWALARSGSVNEGSRIVEGVPLRPGIS